jgi:hypothetical protein
MKTKLVMLIPGILISISGFSQDSTQSSSSKNKVIFKNEPRVHSTIIPAQKSSVSDQHIYRDTRLGSSSPLYDTYEKNDRGAGAVTTNPHKSGSDFNSQNINLAPGNTGNTTPEIHRDTRMGSSSPLYDTYKKNDYGAGAVTTNPNKQGDSSPSVGAPVPDSSRAVPDSVKKD